MLSASEGRTNEVGSRNVTFAVRENHVLQVGRID